MNESSLLDALITDLIAEMPLETRVSVANLDDSEIRVLKLALGKYLKSRLEEIPSVHLFSGPTEQTSSPGSTIFEKDGLDALEAVATLAQNGIHIDEHTRDGHNAIRVSTHFYNTKKNIDDFLAALMKM